VDVQRPGMMPRMIHSLFNVGTVAGLTDAQLLDRFATRADEGAELAFAALVERHGPMVFRVCRGVLRDRHDAEDAFQATFLLLARKAGAIRRRESVGSWLYGVACRVASCARAGAARRRRHERQHAAARPEAVEGVLGDDLEGVLNDEIHRLPEPYRAAVVLCYLENLSCDEAALRLRCPVGTVKSRLARGRERLQTRLARRGLAPTAGMLTAVLGAKTDAAVPSALAEAAVQNAMTYSAGSPAVLTLVKGVSNAMIFSRIKLGAAALVACGAVVVCTVRLASGAGGVDVTEKIPQPGAAVTAPPRAEPDLAVSSTSAPALADALPREVMEASVRIKAYWENSVGYGSGTIIRSTPDHSLVLTCAHTYKQDGDQAGSRPLKRIQVAVFQQNGTEPWSEAIADSFSGELVAADFDRDVALVLFRPGRVFPVARLVPPAWRPERNKRMTAVGCSFGNDVSAWSTFVLTPVATTALVGNKMYECIECLRAPDPGRSGGGLFTLEGELAGICNYASPRTDTGLYAAPASIRAVLAKVEGNGLDRTSGARVPAAPPAEAANPEQRLRDLERKLDRVVEQIDRMLPSDDPLAAVRVPRRDEWMSTAWAVFSEDRFVGRFDAEDLTPHRMISNLFVRYLRRKPEANELALLLRPFGPGSDQVTLAPEVILRRLLRSGEFAGSPLKDAVLRSAQLETVNPF